MSDAYRDYSSGTDWVPAAEPHLCVNGECILSAQVLRSLRATLDYIDRRYGGALPPELGGPPRE